MVEQVVPLVASGRRAAAVELLTRLPTIQNDMVTTILDDLVAVLSENESADNG
jgi:hypothetical protein